MARLKKKRNKKYNQNKNIADKMNPEQFKNYENWVKFTLAHKFGIKDYEK